MSDRRREINPSRRLSGDQERLPYVGESGERVREVLKSGPADSLSRPRYQFELSAGAI